MLTEIRDRLTSRTPREVVQPDAAQAAVALIAVSSGADLELLIIRRAERLGDPWSGQMALPGGRRETVDSSLRETAMRETAEEIGVDLGREAMLGQLDDQGSPALLMRTLCLQTSFRVMLHLEPIRAD